MNTVTVADLLKPEESFKEETANQPSVILDDLADQVLATQVKSFSWFQLSESSHSVLSGLKAYYVRVIMNELQQASPREDKITYWQSQAAILATIERDGSNFKTRERMEEIILKYSAILRMTA